MSRSLRAILDESNPNKHAVAGQQARLGTVLSLSPRFVKAAVASSVLALPENAKAAVVLRAFATAATVAGLKTPIPGGAPATTQVGITPSGDVIFNAGTDAVTEAEVHYLAQEGEVIEEVVPVAANVGVPLASRKAVLLLEAESLAGTLTGALTPTARGAAVTTGNAAINAAGNVAFAAADAVTSARIKYVAAPGVGTAKDAVVVALDTEDKGY